MNLSFNGTNSIFFRDPNLLDIAWKVAPNGQRVGTVVADDPFPPSYQSALKVKTLVDRVQFGDGYEQLTESGIRSNKRQFDIRWENIVDAKAVALQRFFTGEGFNSIYYRRPSEWFAWFPPAPLRLPNSIAVRVICLDGWQITPLTYNSNSVTAVFEEVFVP